MGDNCGVTCALSHLDSLEGLGQGTNLVDLDEDGVTSMNLNALLKALSVGNKEVVADELDLLAQTLGKDLPTVPVLLCKAVLDGDDWELLDHFLVISNHFLGGKGATLALEVILAGLLVIELRRSWVHSKAEVLAKLKASSLNSLGKKLKWLLVGLKVWSKAALVTNAGVEALGLQSVLEGVVNLCAPAKSSGEVRSTNRHNHELLEVNVVVSVDATVEDVHHRNRKSVSVCATEVSVKWKLSRSSCSVSNSKRNAENSVCAEATLVWSAVKLDHSEVKAALILCIPTNNKVADLSVDVLDCLQYALAQVTALVAVAKLYSLELTGRSAGRNDCTTKGTVIKNNLNLNGWIATGIEDLTCVNIKNLAHSSPFFRFNILLIAQT